VANHIPSTVLARALFPYLYEDIGGSRDGNTPYPWLILDVNSDIVVSKPFLKPRYVERVEGINLPVLAVRGSG
jgi:hypothetical protein